MALVGAQQRQRRWRAAACSLLLSLASAVQSPSKLEQQRDFGALHAFKGATKATVGHRDGHAAASTSAPLASAAAFAGLARRSGSDTHEERHAGRTAGAGAATSGSATPHVMEVSVGQGAVFVKKNNDGGPIPHSAPTMSGGAHLNATRNASAEGAAVSSSATGGGGAVQNTFPSGKALDEVNASTARVHSSVAVSSSLPVEQLQAAAGPHDHVSSSARDHGESSKSHHSHHSRHHRHAHHRISAGLGPQMSSTLVFENPAATAASRKSTAHVDSVPKASVAKVAPAVELPVSVAGAASTPVTAAAAPVVTVAAVAVAEARADGMDADVVQQLPPSGAGSSDTDSICSSWTLGPATKHMCEAGRALLAELGGVGEGSAVELRLRLAFAGAFLALLIAILRGGCARRSASPPPPPCAKDDPLFYLYKAHQMEQQRRAGR